MLQNMHDLLHRNIFGTICNINICIYTKKAVPLQSHSVISSHRLTAPRSSKRLIPLLSPSQTAYGLVYDGDPTKSTKSTQL